MDNAISNAIAGGAFTRPHKVADGYTCYDVDRSWRGMMAFRETVNPFDFGGNDDSLLPPYDNTPMCIRTYGRWMAAYWFTKHVVIDGNGLAMYEYRDSYRDGGRCVWKKSMCNYCLDKRISIDEAVMSPPIRRVYENPSWTDGSNLQAMIRDMDSPDDDRRAAVASRFFLGSECEWVLDELADDPSPVVKAAVMRSIHTGYNTRMRLLDDPDWRVRRALCERMNGVEMFEMHGGAMGRRLCLDPEPEVRMAFAALMYDFFFMYDRHRFARNLMPLLDGPVDDVHAAVSLLMMEA